MRIGVLGINHKSSELLLRETLAKACQRQFSFEMTVAQDLCCTVLSTCNRTEIYFSSEDLASAHTRILNCLREEVTEPFEHKLYTYFGVDCFFHLAAVTAGLDSVIVGESEIQRQVKHAYEATVLSYRLPSCMHYLFQKSLKIGKQIRAQGPFIHKHQTLPDVILQVSRWFFEDLKSSEILLIGNSEINRKMLVSLKQKKCHRITLITRGVHHAQQLKEEYGVAVHDWSILPRWKEYDLVICGTTHSHFLLSYEETCRENVRTQLIFDLSVPRTIDPQLAKHPRLALFNVEELGKLIDRQKGCDIDALTHSEQMVWAQVQKHLELFRRKESFAIRSEQKALLCAD